ADLQQIAKLKGLDFLARYIVEGFITGLHRSPFHGFSVEFAEHKLYNVGDNTRHIDWRLYARTDRMYLKKYQEETNLRCHLVLDTSGSMLFKGETDEFTKLQFSCYAAAALVDLFRRQRDACSLHTVSESVELQTPCKTSAAHVNQLYKHLENLVAQVGSTGKNTNFIDNLHALAEQLPQRGLLVLFTDLFDANSSVADFEKALQHLNYKGHEVILFNVVNKKYEEDFTFENRPYTFVDMESGAKVKLNPQQVKTLYQEKVSEFLAEMRLACIRYKVDLVEADVSQGFDTILSSYLYRRKKMV
ncbi:MAG: DUF58 domain-containing protein, partial [Luteibaculaceae bacterium]